MHLERWTIDELTESTVILLRSVCQQGIDVTDTDDLRGEVVISRERGLASDLWEEEDDFVLDRQVLAGFIREAVGGTPASELPEPRELREGDVYWIASEVAKCPDTLRQIWEARHGKASFVDRQPNWWTNRGRG